MLRIIGVMCLFVLTSVVLTCIQAHKCKHKHKQAEWQLMPSSCAEICLVWWFRVLSVMRQTWTLTNDCDRQCCSNRDKGNGNLSSLLFQANGAHCLRLWVGLMPCSQMNYSFGRHGVNTGVSALWTPSRPQKEIHCFCYKKQTLNNSSVSGRERETTGKDDILEKLPKVRIWCFHTDLIIPDYTLPMP